MSSVGLRSGRQRDHRRVVRYNGVAGSRVASPKEPDGVDREIVIGLGVIQPDRPSAKSALAGISSGGRPDAASSRPLKLKKATRAVISQISRSLHPDSASVPRSSSSTRPGDSVSLLAYCRSALLLSSRSYSGHVVAKVWSRCSSPVRRRTAAVWSPSQGAPPTFPLTTVATISRCRRLSGEDFRRWRYW